jgi:phthiocerol/phenolphthiocerol synthesis type-I polyketide synthase E
MPDVSARLAQLDADRRKLVEKLLREQPGAPSSSAPPPPMLTFVPAPGTAVDADPGETAKAGFLHFYNTVSEQLDATEVGEFSFFLNYGYSPDLHPQHAAITLPARFINKNSVQLVLELIGDHDIRGARVLDVGCGRGGTVYVLKEFFRCASINGVDLSPKAIGFCRSRHTFPDVRFDVGDAERLSFPDGTFDVVTNVESSHSYPNVKAFYDGVYRVLRPGGVFLYTDCLPAETVVESVGYLARLGFVIERETDITSNVLKSCDEIAVTRVAAFHEGNEPDLMANFLAVPGSEVYDQMKSRRWRYMIYRFRKPAALR